MHLLSAGVYRYVLLLLVEVWAAVISLPEDKELWSKMKLSVRFTLAVHVQSGIADT